MITTKQQDKYAEFLERKTHVGTKSGFEPLWMPDFLFPFQRALTTWAIEKGRAAIFADCGLGRKAVGIELLGKYYKQAIRNLAAVDNAKEQDLIPA